MKIYKLKSGVQIEKDGACYKAEVDDWDEFINDDNLHSKLLWLTEPGRMKQEDACLETEIIAPIGNQELWACFHGLDYWQWKYCIRQGSKPK